MGRPPETEELVSERTKLFIKRERIRRNLMKTRTGETICLQDWEVEILLKWIKDLEDYKKTNEERRLKYGNP